MPFNLKGCFGKAATVLAMGLSLAACESSTEIAAKPNLVDGLVEASMILCDKQTSGMDQAPYAQRLHDALGEASSETLRHFRDNNITVCLDKRLGAIETGVFESAPLAVYYPSGPSRMLAMRDNGKTPGSSGVFDWDAGDYAGTTLNKFKEEFGDGWFTSYAAVSAASERMVAYRGGCGKNCRTSKWEKESEWSSSGFNYPSVQNAPVIGAP